MDSVFVKVFIYSLKDFIYLLEREGTGGGAEGEADSSLSWEPNVGLDRRTLRQTLN